MYYISYEYLSTEDKWLTSFTLAHGSKEDLADMVADILRNRVVRKLKVELA